MLAQAALGDFVGSALECVPAVAGYHGKAEQDFIRIQQIDETIQVES